MATLSSPEGEDAVSLRTNAAYTGFGQNNPRLTGSSFTLFSAVKSLRNCLSDFLHVCGHWLTIGLPSTGPCSVPLTKSHFYRALGVKNSQQFYAACDSFWKVFSSTLPLENGKKLFCDISVDHIVVSSPANFSYFPCRVQIFSAKVWKRL